MDAAHRRGDPPVQLGNDPALAPPLPSAPGSGSPGPAPAQAPPRGRPLGVSGRLRTARGDREAALPERGARSRSGGPRRPSGVRPAGRSDGAAMAETAPQPLELPSGLLELCALLGVPRDSLRGQEPVRTPRGN